jgi:ribosomal protein S18 acetylase RimI-like enzyme
MNDMKYTIQLLGSGDEHLLVEAVHLTDEGPISAAQAEEFLADENMVNLAAISEKRVVGFVYGYILRRFETVSLFIYLVDVVEEFQRCGIARAMLNALDAKGRGGAWSEMFVFTNASNVPAMQLYASTGGVRPNTDDVMFDFICK